MMPLMHLYGFPRRASAVWIPKRGEIKLGPYLFRVLYPALSLRLRGTEDVDELK